jgi:hypothetical protein
MTLRARLWGEPDARWQRADAWWNDTVSRFKTPAKKCPRGCSYEVARRELVTRSTWLGRAEVRVVFSFETSNCHECGSRLLGHCQRCGAAVVAPIRDRCESCGLPQPWSPERLSSARRMRPRRWKSNANEPAELLFSAPGDRGRLLVIEGDITNLSIDAIVSNDDVDGRMYTVIASAVRERAGQDVEDQSMAQGPFKPGHAWFTDAGSMSWIDGIVHVAAMDRRGDTNIETIRACMRAALEETVRQRLQSVGIAAFGTGLSDPGTKGVSLDDWIDAIAEVTVQFVKALPEPPELPVEPGPDVQPEDRGLSVVVVLYEPRNFGDLRDRLKEAAETSDTGGPPAPRAA